MEGFDEETLRQLLQGAGVQTEGTLEQLKAILPEILAEVDQGVEILDEVLDKYAPKLAEYYDKVREFSVQMDIKTFKEYQKGGLDNDQAFGLLITRKRHRQEINLSEIFEKIKE